MDHNRPCQRVQREDSSKENSKMDRSFLNCNPQQMKLRPRKKICYKETLRHQDNPIATLCPSDLSMQDRLSNKASSEESLAWDAYTEDLHNQAFMEEPQPTQKLALNQP